MSTAANAGTVIEGKYRLERELGAGGMGSVWLATQLMVDRNVAVKLLHPSFIESDDIQARFEVEAKAIGRLHHPNCITLFDFGFSDDLNAFYTVIEYIDGISLDKRLGKRLPLDEIVATIRQIAMALGHAHHQGILHRDLKPENVMVSTMTDGSEMVKVLDFGIARIVKGDSEPGSDQAEKQRLTKAGEVFGTPAYMSPEQARSTRSLTPAADLYSLGVMFYELVDGGLPFFANSAFDLLMMHVTRPVPPIERPDVPDDLKRIIYKLLEKEPEKRFQSGPELINAIDELELPKKAGGEVLDDDFEAGPTRITPPPSAPLTPVPAAAADASREFQAGVSNPAANEPSNPTGATNPTLVGHPDSSGSFASASGSFPVHAGSSGSFPADASVSGAFAADASASGAFAADSSASGAFAADSSASGAFPADSSGARQEPGTTTGPIDFGRRKRLAALSVVLLLLVAVVGVVIGVTVVDNGDAVADPAVDGASQTDPDVVDEPEPARPDSTPEPSLELAAGTDEGPDAGSESAETELSEETSEVDAGVADSARATPRPSESAEPEPRPERKRPTRVKRTTRKTSKPKRTVKDDPPKVENIIKLSIDEDEDEEETKVQELSID